MVYWFGTVHRSAYLSICAWACTRSGTIRDIILEFHMWINYANEWTIFFFFVAFGVAEIHPFIKSFVLIFSL